MSKAVILTGHPLLTGERLAEIARDRDVVRLDGFDVTPADILAEIRNQDLFMPERLIVIPDLRAKGWRSDSKDIKALAEYFKNLPVGMELVIATLPEAEESAAVKLLAKVGKNENYPAPKYYETARMKELLVARAGKRGIRVTPQALERLLETAGDDIGILAAELDRAISLLPDDQKQLGAQDVQFAAAGRHDPDRLTAALFDRNLPKAVAALKEAQIYREDLERLLMGLARDVRGTSRAKLLSAQGLRQDEIAAKLRVSPGLVRRWIGILGKAWQPEELLELLKDFALAQTANRQGRPWPALWELICQRMCGAITPTDFRRSAAALAPPLSALAGVR